jgi:hypothetical protein
LPLEVIGEYEHWRKVRDRTGETGWIGYFRPGPFRRLAFSALTLTNRGIGSPDAPTSVDCCGAATAGLLPKNPERNKIAKRVAGLPPDLLKFMHTFVVRL